MLDLKFIRDNLELVKEAVKNKRERVDLDRLIHLDEQRREMLKQVEALKHQRNVVSQQIGQLKKQGKDANEPIARMQEVADKIKLHDEAIKTIATEMREIQVWVPNIPHVSAPIGKSEKDNVEIRRWGELPHFEFQPKPHWAIAEKLHIIDFARGSKVAGSFFVSYQGVGAKLQRALINFMLDLHINKHGFMEVYPPFIVNRSSMFATGQLP
ncbi:MAG: serine--tRNA ligase, partial [bacterium]